MRSVGLYSFGHLATRPLGHFMENQRLISKLDELAEQFAALGAELLTPAVMNDHNAVRRLSVKRAALAPTVEKYRGCLLYTSPSPRDRG